MGDIIETDLSDRKPFLSTAPHAKIHFDIKKIKNEPDQTVGIEMMSHVFEISIYLNNSCQLHCQECTHFFKQTLWCTKETFPPRNTNSKNLDITILKNLIFDIKTCKLHSLNFIGGNILLYPHLKELFQELESMSFKICFYLHYLNINENLEPLERLKKFNYSVRLLVHFPLDVKRLKKAVNLLSEYDLDIQPIFIVQCEEEFLLLEGLLKKSSLRSPTFLPYYNKKNLEFFKQNVYVDREIIKTRKPGQHMIDGNGVINMENFGKLTILSNGKVYANVLDPALGTLGKETIYDCVFSELIKGRSWFRVGKNVIPCKMCTFNLLCPPISNYNRAIGRNDLCTIRRYSNYEESNNINYR